MDTKREIKFRAWDDINKKMHEHRSINVLVKNININRDKKQQWYYMQYTGLKDKNGVEIYEGDILKYMGFEVLDGKQIRPTRHFTISSESFIQDSYTVFCLMDCNGTCEIIGNIHENPELLK